MATIAATVVILWALARIVYVSVLPGVPDSGLLPTPALPGALWEYTSGDRLITTTSGILVWSLSAAVFLIPPFVGACIASNATTRLGVGIYCACISMAAWLLIQRGLGEYGGLTTFDLAAWILALSCLGFSGGIATRWLLTQRKANAQQIAAADRH